MFNSKIGIGVLKHPGYNGKGGSTSTSTSIDFFGEGKREPYEQLLSALLLGGTIGGTPGYYIGGSKRGGGGGGGGPGVGFGNSAYDLIQQSHPFANSYFSTKKNSSQGTYVPGTGGMSIADYIKQTPGYQFGFDQGREAIERSFASRGFGPSGYENLALQNFGNQYAGQLYQQTIQNLMGPSGVNSMGQTSTTTGASPLWGVAGTIAGAFAPGLGSLFAPAGPSTMGATVSDRNLKTNIKHINTINGIKIYSFNYIWSYIKSIGVMAQDLLEMPEYKHAVKMNSMGYTVDYFKLPI